MRETPGWYEPLKRAAEEQGVPLARAIGYAEIRHDDDCARMLGVGRCNCDPDVTLRTRDLPGRPS